MKSISVIGCGALSNAFIDIIKSKLSDKFNIKGVFSRNFSNTTSFATEKNIIPYNDINDLLADKPDYVVELASKEAVFSYAYNVLLNGIDLVIVSIGAFADKNLFEKLEKCAKENNVKVHIASGAIGGFDIMRTFSLIEEPKVIIDTYKPPANLAGAPYLKDITLPSDKSKEIFCGNAKEAIEAFPKNVNVAVAASIASSTLNSSTVRVTSDPGKSSNHHVINLSTSIADASIHISSKADKNNPKSSTITAWNVAALLDNLESSVQFF